MAFFKSTLTAALFSIASAALAQSTTVEKKFADCLLSKARGPQYTSFDGGKSAIQLLGQCPSEWNAYVDACIATGDTDGNCTLKSGVLAQAALKLLNK